jgi:predicted RNase H-like nuclease (RuvC/YqgF family)
MVEDEPKTANYMALITAQETQIASLKAEIESLKTSRGDLADLGEETKKTFEDWATKFSELSERVLGIEGMVGQPAGSVKSRGQSPEDIKNTLIDWCEFN